MIDDEFLAGLPNDAEEAFVILEAAARVEMDESNGSTVDARRRYVIQLYGFITENQLPISIDPDFLLESDTDVFWPEFHALDMRIQMFASQYRHRKAARLRNSPYVVLEPSEKRKIQQYISKIREIIDESELPPGKREALLKRLSELQEEIDRPKTRAEAAFATYLAVKREMGDTGSAIVQFVDKIVTVLAKAKPLIEAITGPKQQKKLPAPKKETENAAQSDFDEEIPF